MIKTILRLIGLFGLCSYTAAADEFSSVLKEEEAKQARMELERNKQALQHYWHKRLLKAKEKQNHPAESNETLKRPYYGDVKHRH